MLHVSLVASFLCSSTCGSSMAASRSPNYLAIIVRQVCKESPKEAIDRQVVSEMKYLVKNTSLTAEQIALRLHFPDTSYVCRYFKKRTGMSISDYKAQLR